MNRFRKNKKEKVKEEVVEVPESSSVGLTSKLSWKSRKEDPEEKPEFDLSSALPSTDDFRTSLLMPKLSARFSMLREQDDPDSIIGKASDDSVLFPKRASRLNLFGHNPGFLADIDEVSIDGRSIAPRRTHSIVSDNNSCGADEENSQKESIMSRGRRVESNNLFGGRQKMYKISSKATSASDSGRSQMSSRALYEPDLTTSAFQPLSAKESVESMTEELPQGSPSQESEDALSRVSSAKRTTFSSTASGPITNVRTSTAATSIDEQSLSGPSPLIPGSEGLFSAPKPAMPGMAAERGSVKSRRLYGQGLAQSAQSQQASTLQRLESLSRQRAGTPEHPPLNRAFSKSATNLRDRMQPLTISEPLPSNPSPTQPTSPQSLFTSPEESLNISSKGLKSPASTAYSAPPLSPPFSESEVGGALVAGALVAALRPEDHGKATASGLFNKPKTTFDESQFKQRQLQMHQGRNTPSLPRPLPPPTRTKLPELPGRARGFSNASYTSRPGSATSHYSEAQRPGSRSATNASPPKPTSTTFFANPSSSDSEDEGRASRMPDTMYTTDEVHPALRPETPSKPSTPSSEHRSPLPEVRYSDLGDLKPIAEHDLVENKPSGAQDLPEKPDSPTLGPSGLGLSGLVRTHLRQDSDRSSIYPPPSPGLSAKPVEANVMADAMPQYQKSAPHSSNWQDELVSRHRREASTETQIEREEFANELAERRRKVQEKLKGFAEVESRSASPVSGRQTPDFTPSKPGNAFSFLKNKAGKQHLFGKQDLKGAKGLGYANASTPALVSDDPWREEEERPALPFAKHANSSTPHITGERSFRSKISVFGRSSQEDSRESSRSRGASPHSSFRSRRDRSTSDASGRSKSRSRRDRDGLETLEEVGHGPHNPMAYPDQDQHGMSSVASSTRPSVEASESAMYERSSSAASIRHRSGSRSAVSSFHDRPSYFSTHSSSLIGAAPRPSPIAPYSANATPPLELNNENGYPLAPAPSDHSQHHHALNRAPGNNSLQKRAVNKTLISEPTFVSCTSSVPTVGLPPGASLSNGMETPPIPPMNPRRRRQTTTQTILGALKGERHESQYSPSIDSAMEETSNFSDDGDKRPKSRARLRKSSSEGGNLNAKARHQLLADTPPPAVPTYPPPQIPLDGGMF
ncbi:uncharacterized protein BO97DRAFT_92281 [Aspergillus homomorphus CBS 101889]|uniref:Uncharacterized protein n=1 Tax=Aspergillus homomorphus (strain CBS 101889) TaxID=1450537 RepID=A0A395HZG0_ASPHC|nr:hypothetical protein BO97DRAFT_92281 [Aspergillus homomorphus CBS 101889]RAL11654.1 hypothetical protein BO97DRAFT_92281 [Aspergillus homomorphus CBS 101889]